MGNNQAKAEVLKDIIELIKPEYHNVVVAMIKELEVS